MLSRLYLSALLIMLTGLLCRCTKYEPPCYYTAEPLVVFNIYAPDSTDRPLPAYHYFDAVYAVGGKGNLVARLNQYELPVNINADSMVIIFEKDGSGDTIQLGYDREEILEGHEGCGFYINIFNMEIISHTFSNVYRDNYESSENHDFINVEL